MADGIDWPTEDEVRQLAYSTLEQHGQLLIEPLLYHQSLIKNPQSYLSSALSLKLPE